MIERFTDTAQASTASIEIHRLLNEKKQRVANGGAVSSVIVLYVSASNRKIIEYKRK